MASIPSIYDEADGADDELIQYQEDDPSWYENDDVPDWRDMPVLRGLTYNPLRR